MAQLKLTQINDTGFLHFPAGTSAQRPSSPQEGMIRYNTDLNQTEYYDGLAWRNIKDFGLKATGGDAVSNIVVGGIPYTVHYFTSTGNSTFTVTKGGKVDVLIVGGGGSGGVDHGGGGGAGELIFKENVFVSESSYTVVVGAGGAAVNNVRSRLPANDGNDSQFDVYTASGGGGGDGRDGGSGGGGRGFNSGLPPEVRHNRHIVPGRWVFLWR